MTTTEEEQMNQLIQTAGANPGISKRSVNAGEITLTSLKGPQKQVAKVLGSALREGYKPENVIAFGISRDGQQTHLVGFDPEDGQKIDKAQLSETSLSALHLDGFDYAHLVATMDDGVNVAAFQDRFEPDEDNGKAFGNFARAIFEKGQVIGAEDGSNAMLLLAPKGNRTLVASRKGYKGPLTKIEQPEEITDQRYTVIDRTTLTVTEYGTGKVHALKAQDISYYIQDGQIPSWSECDLGDNVQILDMSLGVNKTGTVILTAKVNGEPRFVPASTAWVKEQFKMNPVLSDGIETGKTAPIVRAGKDRFVAVDGNGGTTRLTVEATKDHGALAAMVDKASQGAYAQAA